MQIRGAASLADVPYWRKTNKRLTRNIIRWASRFLKRKLSSHEAVWPLVSGIYRGSLALSPAGQTEAEIAGEIASRVDGMSTELARNGFQIPARASKSRTAMLT
ncbi:MAG TPA: hypothetical protein VN843_31495, partial [Anaerolineales bacterium]|nr:hypothetical protein [Anaerolineales bacterium]